MHSVLTKEGLDRARAKGIVGGRRPKFEKGTVERVRELRSQGMTLRQVALKTGVSLSRVAQLIKKYGCT